MTSLKIEWEDEDGTCHETDLPAYWEVCSRCRGEGVHDHPAFSNGFTSSEWAEMCDGDPDWPEQYFSGRYDVPCSECKGRTTVLVPNVEAIEKDPGLKEAYDAWQEQLREDARYRSEERYLRRLESGEG